MAKQFLDATGLLHLWEKINGVFQKKLVSGNNIKTINGTSIVGSGNITTPNTTYVKATSSTLGLVKIGATGLGSKEYAVQLNSSGQMYVSVPWTDTQGSYTLPAASSSTRGGIKIGSGLSISNTDVVSVNFSGYATQSWVTSQGFAKGSFLPLTGGTISGDLIRATSGDVKRSKISNTEISVYDSVNSTCKARLYCTSNYSVVEVGNNLNSKDVRIDANTGITIKGTGMGIRLSSGGSNKNFFASDGSIVTVEALTTSELNEVLV